MKTPSVSIIIPIYKVEKYLKRCVESVREQTLSDLEIILVDDGSPDQCPEICDEYAKLDTRIKVIHKKMVAFLRHVTQECVLLQENIFSFARRILR